MAQAWSVAPFICQWPNLHGGLPMWYHVLFLVFYEIIYLPILFQDKCFLVRIKFNDNTFVCITEFVICGCL